MKGSFAEVSKAIKAEFALLNTQLEMNIYETPIESELFYFELRVYGYLNIVVASKWTNFYFQRKSSNYLLDAYADGEAIYLNKYVYEIDVPRFIERVTIRFYG